MRQRDLEFFWTRVDKLSESPCWLWTGSSHKNGYGQTYVEGRSSLAHRVAWMIGHGNIPRGLMVLHHCDNRWCVNYERCLFLGTNADNMNDAWSKGRGIAPVLPGESNGRAKLTEHQVREIRHRWEVGGVLQRELAEEYGIAKGYVSLIVNRVSWQDAQKH